MVPNLTLPQRHPCPNNKLTILLLQIHFLAMGTPMLMAIKLLLRMGNNITVLLLLANTVLLRMGNNITALLRMGNMDLLLLYMGNKDLLRMDMGIPRFLQGRIQM